MRAETSLINRFVGRRIRERRVMLGMSQRQIGEPIGITVQQVFKYEHGQNGVTAGLLFEIGRVLGTPPDYFFEGLEEEATATVSPGQRVLLNLLRSLGDIQSREQLAVICQLTRALMTKQQPRSKGAPRGVDRRVKKEPAAVATGKLSQDANRPGG
jgi:transcriptional regulator with XRE-family HTH domain